MMGNLWKNLHIPMFFPVFFRKKKNIRKKACKIFTISDELRRISPSEYLRLYTYGQKYKLYPLPPLN